MIAVAVAASVPRRNHKHAIVANCATARVAECIGARRRQRAVQSDLLRGNAPPIRPMRPL